jgi:hypothetical protein
MIQSHPKLVWIELRSLCHQVSTLLSRLRIKVRAGGATPTLTAYSIAELAPWITPA